MKVTLLLLVLFLTQVSGSFFDDFRGEMTSLAENFENFVNDVVYDVRETIDCSILAVKQVLALGNFAESSYYNTNCKTPNYEYDSQEDNDDIASSIVTPEIVSKEDEYDTADIPESTDVFVKSQSAKNKPEAQSYGNNFNDNEFKNKNKKETKYLSENSNSTDKIKQDNQDSSVSPAENSSKSAKIVIKTESSEINNTHITIVHHSNTNGKNETRKLQSSQNIPNKTLFNNGSLNLLESAGTPVDKNSTAENVQNKLQTLIDTHKKLKQTKHRLENKTKELDKLHTVLHHELRNLTSTVQKVIQEASVTPVIKTINVHKNVKENETIINSSRTGTETNLIGKNSINRDNKTNNMPLSHHSVGINVTNDSETSYNNGNMSISTKKLINEDSRFNTSKNTIHGNAIQKLLHLSLTQKQLGQNISSIEKETKDLGKMVTLLHSKLNNATANNKHVNQTQYINPARTVSKVLTKTNNIDTVVHSSGGEGNRNSNDDKHLNVLAKEVTGNASLPTQHMTKNEMTEANNSLNESNNESNKNKHTLVLVNKNPKYNTSIENLNNASVGGYRDELEQTSWSKPLQSELGNQTATIHKLLQDEEWSTQNKSEEPTNIVKTNATAQHFRDRHSNIDHVENAQAIVSSKDNNVKVNKMQSFRDVAKNIVSQPTQSKKVTNKKNIDNLDYDSVYSDDTSDEDYYDDEPFDYQDYNDLFQNTDDVKSHEKAAERVKKLIENSKRSEKVINDYLRKAEKHGIDLFDEPEDEVKS